MMQQGIDTLEIDQMAAPQAQGIETLGSMEDAPMIPNGGIQAAVPDATRMLADAGRYGDIYVVHASEGETVVPKEVLEGPGGQQIRGMLFRQMEQLGVDPQRYVVGNELNSINPETGLPEFFFKKIFKSIKKIFKKVAPIVLPIALSLTPLGPILGSAIGSGIGSLIQGGSAKDALKAAAFGGITAGIASGVGGVLQGSGNIANFGSEFVGGVKAGFPTFGGLGGTPTLTRLGLDKLGGEGGTSVIKGSESSAGGSSDIFKEGAPFGNVNIRTPSGIKVTGAPGGRILDGPPIPDELMYTTDDPIGRPFFKKPFWAEGMEQGALRLENLPSKVDKTASDQGFLNKLFKGAGDYAPSWMGGTPDAVAQSSLVDARLAAYKKAIERGASPGLAEKLAMQVSGGSNLKQYIAPGILALGAATAGGFFETPEEEEFKSTFGDPIDQSLVDRFRVDTGTYAPRAPINFSQFPTNQAYGGEMQNFPPRIGAISGPGTEKSDDIPAMLSDGEFVMTAQAVRGAGNGSRRQGVKNLYDIMRNFEAVA